MLQVTLQSPEAHTLQGLLQLEQASTKTFQFPFWQLRIAFAAPSNDSCKVLFWLKSQELLSRNGAMADNPFAYQRFAGLHQNNVLLLQSLEQLTGLLGGKEWEALSGACQLEFPSFLKENTPKMQAWFNAAGFKGGSSQGNWTLEFEGKMDDCLRKSLLLLTLADPEAHFWVDGNGKQQVAQLARRWLADHPHLEEMLADLNPNVPKFDPDAFLFNSYHQDFGKSPSLENRPLPPALLGRIQENIQSIAAKRQLHFCLSDAQPLERLLLKSSETKTVIAAPRALELQAFITSVNQSSIDVDAKRRMQVIPLSPLIKHLVLAEQDAILFWNMENHIQKVQLHDLLVNLLHAAGPKLVMLQGCEAEEDGGNQVRGKHIQNWAKAHAETFGYLFEFDQEAPENGTWLAMFHQNAKR